MVFGNKQKLFDVSLECILDNKSRSMRFVLSKNGVHEFVIAKMQKLEIIQEDCDIDFFNSYSFSRDSGNQNYSYRISGSEISCFCFDEKKLIYYISKSIAAKFIQITDYETEADKFVKELKDKNFVRVKTKDKNWFNNWIIKIVKKKILGFVLNSNKIIIGNCNTEHLDILKYTLDVFGRKNWESYNTDIVREILSHETIFKCNFKTFKEIFPNKLSLLCMKYACIENKKIKFFRNIKEEDGFLFDSWDEAISLRHRHSNSFMSAILNSYGNVSMPADFIDGIFMINEKTKIENRADFVNAVGISYAVFEKLSNSSILHMVGGDSFKQFQGVSGNIELFDKIYSDYCLDKMSYASKIKDYVIQKGIAKNKKKNISHLIAMYPKYVSDFWNHNICSEGHLNPNDMYYSN